jgi:alpha-ketoglutarate-dependent 2,4-dichlorophenoxyacetate dioxygenase
VNGVDVAQELDSATFAAILAAFNEHAVLVFPAQMLDDESQTAFAARFGPLADGLRQMRMFKDRPVRAEVLDLSNVDEAGRLIKPDGEKAIPFVANLLWHSDYSFKAVPALASLLSGRIVAPEGGETEFADMRAAWEALPRERQRAVEGLVVEHHLAHSLKSIGYEVTHSESSSLPPVHQALVRTHPVTGRKGLYLSSHASHIVGWPIEKGRELLRELTDFATQPKFVYRHHWRTGDLVIWDNRCTMHRLRPWDVARYKRIMRRATVAGQGPTVVEGRPVSVG